MVVEDHISAPEKAGAEYVLFGLGSYEMGLDATCVVEIVSPVTITPVPEAEDFMAGVINYRGEIISVIDLGLLIGEAPAEPDAQAIIIVRIGETKSGLIVSCARQVRRIEAEDTIEIDAAHPLAKFIRNTATVESRLVFIVDLELLVERAPATEVSGMSAERSHAKEISNEPTGD